MVLGHIATKSEQLSFELVAAELVNWTVTVQRDYN